MQYSKVVMYHDIVLIRFFHGLYDSDVRDDLRRSCYSSAKAKEGPSTHHIIFYYNYGPNAFG
jgi:hypothetical protein